MKTFASHFDFAPGSRTEAFAALTPFLFSMVMVLFGYLARYWTTPLGVQIAFVILFWVSVLGVFLLGSAKGLPRWFLPYLGFPLPIISLLIFSAWINRRPDFNLPWLVADLFMEGLIWGWMIPIVAAFLLIAVWIPKFRPFYRRIRQDWTLLSFMLYGTTPFVLAVTFDGYVNDEPFFFLSLLMLALGGWFYLQNDESLKRFVSLHIGLALSMLTATVGKAVLFMGSWFQVFDSTWKDELVPTLMTWAWLALIMSLPRLLKLFQRPDKLVTVT